MFEQRAAFVTGGGTGIGLACAQAIVDGGGRVTIAGRWTDVLKAAADALGERASWVECDVTQTQSVDDAIATAVERNGPFHVAVNSAYGAMVGSFLATPPDLFAMTTDSTLNGTYRSMQAEANVMASAPPFAACASGLPLCATWARCTGGPRSTLSWSMSPRVVLLGDAAHACSPTMAQGGSLAIEDAVVLAEALEVARDITSGQSERRDPSVRRPRTRSARAWR